MKLKNVLIFSLGFLTCFSLFYVFIYVNSNFTYSNALKFGGEVPFGTGLVGLDRSLAPSDRISEDDIIILRNRIVLEIPNATLSHYADSGSMNPLLDEGANGIRIVPENEESIDIGDIVSYRFGDILVVHRVIEKGIDSKGVYFVMQGDNNLMNDGKIRFKDIEYITVGIIY